MKKIIFSTLIICLIFLAGGYAGYCVGHNDQESNITMSRDFSGGGAEEKYVIPYIKIAGCPDDELQWKINKTIFNEACWIFSCAENGDHLYHLFLDDGSKIELTHVFQYKNYISLVYEGPKLNDIYGYITYSIVVDLFTGERILLGDVLKDDIAFKQFMLTYFAPASLAWELSLDEEDADMIIEYGKMTEAEAVIYNKRCDTGKIESISMLFDSVSFYMCDDGFVIMPKAEYYGELIFKWDDVKPYIVL